MHGNSRDMDWPLPSPRHPEGSNCEGVLTRQVFTEVLLSNAPNDPVPHCSWVSSKQRGRHRCFSLGSLQLALRYLVSQRIERVGVFGGKQGGTGERVSDARAEFLFEEGQDPLSHPHSRVTRICVVRISPRLEPLGCTRSRRGEPGHARFLTNKRAHHDSPACKPALPRDPSKRPCTRATSEREQHLLGLVVTGVRGHDPPGTRLHTRGLESTVAGIPRGSLRPRTPCTRCPLGRIYAQHSHRVETQAAGLSRSSFGDLRRSCLQAVVNDHGPRAHAGLWCLERKGSRERERVRATRESDEHKQLGVPLWLNPSGPRRRSEPSARAPQCMPQCMPHRQAGVGYRTVKPRWTLVARHGSTVP